MRPIRVAIGAAALVLAAFVVWRFAEPIARNRNPSSVTRPELSALVKAIGVTRPFEPRLYGGFSYGPYRLAKEPVGTVDLSPDVRIAIARIEKTASASRSDADWAALGVASLIAGPSSRGLEYLEAAAASAVPDPRVLNDLAVAYLVVGRERDRAELIPQALAAAELAYRLDNRLREAAFNRALALEELHLDEQAENAWKAYRSIDPDSDWSLEAQAHLTRIEQSAAAVQVRWEQFDRTVEEAVDDRTPDLERIVAGRYRIRLRIETRLIPAWAERLIAGDPIGARDQLRHARTVADLLARAGGDPMPRDAIRVIDEAEQRGNHILTRRLANAHLGASRAFVDFDEGRVTDADREYRSTVADFTAANSPYVHWAPIYRAVALYGARQFTEAREVLSPGRTEAIDNQYRNLAGRRRWLVGLIDANEGRLPKAVEEYQKAQTNFQSVGEADGEAAVTALLAEVLTTLGMPGEAWRYEMKALAQAVQYGGGARWPLLLQLGGALCLNADMPGAALHFQDALIGASISRRRNRSAALTDGFLHRAQISERLGDSNSARADLGRAKEQLNNIDDAALRRREEAEVSAAEAEVLRRPAPSAAIESASRAISFFRDPGGETRLPGLYLSRAMAQIAADHLTGAENDLSEAIRHFESQRSHMSERQYRASFFQDGWQAFAQMSRVQYVLKRDPGVALEFAERGRARTLLEAAANVENAQPQSTAAIQSRMPEDTAAVFFVTLEDRLLTWVVKRDQVSLVERPVGVARLRAMVSRTTWLMRQTSGAETRLLTELGDLYADLIEPLNVGTVRRIVIVPDGPLHALPFAALVNEKTKRYLVQDYEVMTAPSLSMMIASNGAQLSAGWKTGKLRALVVGNPSRDLSIEQDWLPSLPFSEEEARQVAALYPDATILSADNATKHSMLRRLGENDILHYAGHALVNDQTPSLSRLLLAPDSETADDGSLFVSELSRVRLQRTRLVVLAACSTGTGTIANGEGVQSLARPFLEAGAMWVVATYWDIQDRGAADFFLAFHKEIGRGRGPAAALSQVQRHFIENPEQSKRRPSQWAWAVLVGSIGLPEAN